MRAKFHKVVGEIVVNLCLIGTVAFFGAITFAAVCQILLGLSPPNAQIAFGICFWLITTWLAGLALLEEGLW